MGCAVPRIWTTGYDTKNLVMYYHTQHNRRVRKINLGKVDFEKSREIVRLPLDKEKKQDIEDVTPTMKRCGSMQHRRASRNVRQAVGCRHDDGLSSGNPLSLTE